MHGTHFQEQLDWLIKTSKEAGWKPYAWDKAKRLEACDTGMYRGLRDALTVAMGGTVPSNDCANQPPTKPPSAPPRRKSGGA